MAKFAVDPRHPLSPKDEQVVLRLHKELGFSPKAIAMKAKVPVVVIRNILKKNGVKFVSGQGPGGSVGNR